MRNISKMILLGAGILFTLTGCQKGTSSVYSGQKIHFGALSGAPTRTAYSGEGTGSDGVLSWERIDWVNGDQIMIASDKAADRVDGTNKYATYSVFGVSANGDISKASIADDEGKGLLWGSDDSDGYTFWGVYPASLGKAADLTAGKVTFTIATPQEFNEEGKTDMDQAVMLAMITGAKPSDNPVDLKFYPAYTAFEIVLKAAAGPVDLTKVELSSTSNMVGTVTATLAEGTTTNSAGKNIGASTFTDPTDAGTVLTFEFPENTQVTKDEELTFTVFALPIDIVKLKMKFYSGADYHEATLKSKTDGDNITFDACRKHKIYGLALPDSEWHVYLEADVAEWKEKQLSIEYGEADSDGVVISASALTHITGATSWSRTAATLATTSALKAFYSVYSPTNGKWRITLKGDDAANFTIATDPTGTTGTDADGNPYIQGAVDGRVIFTLTPTDAAAAGDSVELWFTVVMVEGEGDAAVEKQYLLHSEVTRSNSPLTVTLL